MLHAAPAQEATPAAPALNLSGINILPTPPPEPPVPPPAPKPETKPTPEPEIEIKPEPPPKPAPRAHNFQTLPPIPPAQAARTTVVVVVDISTSVTTALKRSGSSMQAMQASLVQYIQTLPAGVQFNLLQHSRTYTQLYKQPRPLTKKIRAEVLEYLATSFITTGRSPRAWKRNLPHNSPGGIEAVLAAALENRPTTLVLASDFNYQRTRPGTRAGENVPRADAARAIQFATRRHGVPSNIHLLPFGALPKNTAAMQKVFE